MFGFEKYPEVVSTFDVDSGSKPCTPQYNTIKNNKFCRVQNNVDAYAEAADDNILENNVDYEC